MVLWDTSFKGEVYDGKGICSWCVNLRIIAVLSTTAVACNKYVF